MGATIAVISQVEGMRYEIVLGEGMVTAKALSMGMRAAEAQSDGSHKSIR